LGVHGAGEDYLAASLGGGRSRDGGGLVQVSGRLSLKFRATPCGTKIVGLATMLDLSRGLRGIHLHAANGIGLGVMAASTRLMVVTVVANGLRHRFSS
jgi:hypothetical protein